MTDAESLMAAHGSVGSHGDGPVQISSVVRENESLNLNILKELDSYWDDINDRLTISRMVNDSVIRGMVNAIELVAAEKIAQKDLEVSRLRETLLLYHVGAEENESSQSHFINDEVDSSLPNVLAEHDKIQGSLGNRKTTAMNQLEMLIKELNKIRRLDQMKEMDASVEKSDLSGSLHENVSEKWIGVDKMLDSLKNILDTPFKRMNVMELFSLSQQEHDFREEIERRVITNFFRSIKEENEQRLCEQDVEFGGNRGLLLQKIKEIANLRQELESISKLLSGHENGQHTSNGGVEAGEERNQNRADHLHRKVSGSYISSPSLCDANGKHEESVTSASENFDALKHLSHDDLISHFKNEMNQMKREHDYKIQQKTEENFRLKRECLNLKERGSFSPVKRDKEFDALRKKIPEVILKLDKILLKNERLVSVEKDNSDLKSRLEAVLLENRQLSDSLLDKGKENILPSPQVSDAAEKMSQLSQAEANRLNVIEKLESAVEDSQIKASILEDVYGCFLGELLDLIKCAKEETDLEHHIAQEVCELVSKDAANREASESKDDFGDSYVESLITHECCAVMYREALREAEEKLGDLSMKYICESKARNSLEMEVSEKENALRSEMLEKERLQHLVEEKEKLVQTTENTLANEREGFVLAAQEISNLQNLISQQERTVMEQSEESGVIGSKLAEALDEMKGYEVEIHDLGRELELAREKLKKIDNEKMRLLAITHETQQKLSATESEEKKLRTQIESLIVASNGLIKGLNNLEKSVAEKSKKTNSRLKNMDGQLGSLSVQTDELKARALMCKQRLERKCSDLQKAEAEVDLLGDEVESLLDLLKKIYMALDHYSPVLKHYSGIMEILKLVRRELSGESKRPV